MSGISKAFLVTDGPSPSWQTAPTPLTSGFDDHPPSQDLVSPSAHARCPAHREQLLVSCSWPQRPNISTPFTGAEPPILFPQPVCPYLAHLPEPDPFMTDGTVNLLLGLISKYSTAPIIPAITVHIASDSLWLL